MISRQSYYTSYYNGSSFGALKYTYCANNPVIYIDPNGEEKINLHNKKKDPTLYQAAERAYDDNAIHIFAHGSKKGFSFYNENTNKMEYIRSAKSFSKFLSNYSETWKNRKEGEQITIVLNSCNVGKEDGSFMQDILKSDEFKDVVIIAADQFVWGNSTTGKQTSADALRGKDDNIKYDKSEKKMRGNLGHWNIFYGGEKIRSVSGDWQPSYIPKSIIELIKSSNEINNKE